MRDDPLTPEDYGISVEGETIDALELELQSLRDKVAKLERLRDFDIDTIPLPKGVMLEYARLDNMWRKLVKEKGDLKAENACLKAEVERMREIPKSCPKCNTEDMILIRIIAQMNEDTCIEMECLDCSYRYLKIVDTMKLEHRYS